MLPWGKLGEGVSMVGGRGRGIFFNTLKADSRGLKSGDQLIKVTHTHTHTILSINFTEAAGILILC